MYALNCCSLSKPEPEEFGGRAEQSYAMSARSFVIRHMVAVEKGCHNVRNTRSWQRDRKQTVLRIIVTDEG